MERDRNKVRIRKDREVAIGLEQGWEREAEIRSE